jgi:hypothetical protein
MLQQYEPIAQYELRSYTSIFSALQEIAKKVED